MGKKKHTQTVSPQSKVSYKQYSHPAHFEQSKNKDDVFPAMSGYARNELDVRVGKATSKRHYRGQGMVEEKDRKKLLFWPSVVVVFLVYVLCIAVCVYLYLKTGNLLFISIALVVAILPVVRLFLRLLKDILF